MNTVSKSVAFATLALLEANCSAACAAQAAPVPPVSSAPFDQRTGASIDKLAYEFLEQARTKPDGSVSTTLEKYPGHVTMLTARTKPGGAELHREWSDFFIVLEGEATERVGGTIVDAKETTPGEVRGKEVAGGVDHVMRKGDVIHIAPGTPHQTVIADGKYFLYYVIKVQAPAKKYKIPATMETGR